jgi:hypothetical protein
MGAGERAAADPTVVPELLGKLRGQGALADEIARGWAASIPRGDHWDPGVSRAQGIEYHIIGPQAGFNPAALRSLNPADTDIAHALSAAGSIVLSELLLALERQDAEPWWVTCTLVSVLGSLGHVVQQATAREQLRIAEVLMRALTHRHVWVRRNAADAVGTTMPLLRQIGNGQIQVWLSFLTLHSRPELVRRCIGSCAYLHATTKWVWCTDCY